MSARAYGAEAVGAFAVVAATCGAQMLAVPAGLGPFAPALAAGLAFMAMHAALAPVSGGHFNPAVTIGLITAGRFDAGHLIGYVLAQVLGAAAAAWLLQFVVANAMAGGPAGNIAWGGMVALSNTYGGARGFNLTAAVVVEVMAAALLLIVFAGVSGKKGGGGMGALAIGAALAVLTLLALPVTNAALNPARATATAVLAGGAPLSQLWIFWAAPIGGAIVGGAIAKWLHDDRN